MGGLWKGPSIYGNDLVLVVGLNRTGKSCRLRWVNYLHPGLKRGKMTPQEERLVLELHSKWGNRWSKIARKMPGRTDNEIKNYWRTHMRKKAQEKKQHMSPASSSSNCCSSSMTTTTTQDSGRSNGEMIQELEDGYYSMDDIWREIDQSGANITKPVKDIYNLREISFLNFPPLATPTWESSLESIWNMEADESKISSSYAIDQFPFSFEHGDLPSL